MGSLRIGVLTFCRAFNPGALLQAYASAVILRRRFPGAVVEMVDYAPRRGLVKEYRLLLLSRPVIAGVAKKMAHIAKFRKFQQDDLPLTVEGLVSDNYERALSFLDRQHYDAVFVGSDTVFEQRSPPAAYAPRLPNLYWLGEKISAYKFSLAASADKTERATITSAEREIGGRLLQGFSLLGVRDEFTRELLEWYGAPRDKLRLMPDPTISIEAPQAGAGHVLAKLGLDLRGPTLGLNVSQPRLASAIAHHYRAKGYTIIAPIFSRFADINLRGAITPLQWAEVYKYFTFTITDRFHGTIFALKNGSRVCSIDVAAAEHGDPGKKALLLRALEMSDHHLRTAGLTDKEVLDALTEIELRPVSKGEVDYRMRELARATDAYLDEAASLILREPVGSAHSPS